MLLMISVWNNRYGCYHSLRMVSENGVLQSIEAYAFANLTKLEEMYVFSWNLWYYYIPSSMNCILQQKQQIQRKATLLTIMLIACTKCIFYMVFFITVLLLNQKILSEWTEIHSGDFQDWDICEYCMTFSVFF